MTRIVLLGKTGQVGRELQRTLAPLGEVIALDRRGSPWPPTIGDAPASQPCLAGSASPPGGALATAPSRIEGDLSEPASLVRTIRALRPDFIVNAAAYTAVDKAESEPDLARLVNAEAPGALAREAATAGTVVIHYSTDYVFDGSGTRPWREDDPARPLSVYGRTKLEGEHQIRASGCPFLILRTSWVYSTHGTNFLKTILRLAGERDTLGVVADQVGAPTSATLIADITAQLLSRLLGPAPHNLAYGTYHLAARGTTNWCDYARYAVGGAAERGAALRLAPASIRPIATDDYVTPAPRPRNSRLDCRKLESALAVSLPRWERDVDVVLDALVAGRT